jgi:hypothetical protein
MKMKHVRDENKYVGDGNKYVGVESKHVGVESKKSYVFSGNVHENKQTICINLLIINLMGIIGAGNL